MSIECTSRIELKGCKSLETSRDIVGFSIRILRTHVVEKTQTELCQEMKVTQGYLSKVENGIQELGIKDFYNLLASFNMNSLVFEECVNACAKIIIKENIERPLKKVKPEIQKKIVVKLKKIISTPKGHTDLKGLKKARKRVS